MSLHAHLGADRGSVSVLFAVAMPLLLLFLSLSIDVGHWYEHRRHLQTQADAGALAGGGLFNNCFTTSLATANAAINAQTLKYAGDPGSTPRYNAQVGTGAGEGVVVRINRKTYDRGGPRADDTLEQDPCTAGMVDVKISDENVPWFLRFAGLASQPLRVINAHARIQARKLVDLQGSLPVAVPDPEPKVASVTFFNPSGGAAPCTTCTFALTGPTITGGVAQFTMPSTAAINVTAGQNVGVKVNLGGETSTTCGAAYVLCYGGSTGLAQIHGYSTSGTPPATGALLRAVWPTSGSCSNQVSRPGAAFFYGLPYNAPCSVNVSATIAFGSGITNPTVTATFMSGNTKLATQNMTLASGVWSTGLVSLPAQTGPITVDISWKKGGNSGDFGIVQQVYSAQRATSGPIKTLQVTEPGSSATGSPLALTAGTHNLKVTIGTQYLKVVDFHNLDPTTDETVGLRVADPSGSQNQAFDCDAGVTFRDEIINGCKTPYGPNPNHPGCPETTPPTPADCMNVTTGDKVGQLEQGLDQRLGSGGSCTVNHWPNVQDGDPRGIPLIITQFGAFTGAGGSINSQVPVRRFGYFYVTGWSRSNCSTNEAYPWSSDKQNSKGDIWGHFIFHVFTINQGGGGNQVCVLNNPDPLDINPCVAVLTR